MTTPPTPTRERIDSDTRRLQITIGIQLLAEPNGVALEPQDVAALQRLLSAIPALTAEFEALRVRCEYEQSNGARRKAEADALREQRDDERKAHAETRRELDRLPTRNQVLLAEREAWQSATGHASPEAYRASRVELGADVIERLGEVALNAMTTAFMADTGITATGQARAGIRAVVAALAEMGAEALPNAEEIADAWNGDWKAIRPDIASAQAIRSSRVRSLLAARLAPVLGARRALELPSEKEIAKTLANAYNYPGAHTSLDIDAARAVLELLRSRSAPPTDEQLAEEAVSRFGAAECFACERAGYAAGARREGRR